MASTFIVKKRDNQCNYAPILCLTPHRETAMDFYLRKVLDVSTAEQLEEKIKKIRYKANTTQCRYHMMYYPTHDSYREQPAIGKLLRNVNDFDLVEIPLDEKNSEGETINRLFFFTTSRHWGNPHAIGTFSLWFGNDPTIYTCSFLTKINELWIKYQNHGMNLIEEGPR